MMKRFIYFALVILLFSGFAIAEEAFQISEITIPSKALRASDPEAYECDGVILLNNEQTSFTGDHISFDNNTVTIFAAGSYYLSGTLEGSIFIDSPDEEKITLFLDGIHVKSSDQSCILSLSSGKNLTISPVNGSVNILECAFSDPALLNDGTYDAAIFSKTDLKFKSDGHLYITCTGGKGINCRDDIVMQNPLVQIVSTDDGIRGKDSVTVSGGHIRISAGADGIRSSNDEDAEKGYIVISGGLIEIDAQADAIQAVSTLTITGGEVFCRTGSGPQAKEASEQKAFSRGGKGYRTGAGWETEQQTDNEDSVSAKALKSDGDIHILGGTVHSDSQDDAIHAGQSVYISDGSLYLASGDDGIHADDSLLIDGGSILISESFEGIEAPDIQISGGEIRLYASDDGVNAAGGELAATSNYNKGHQRGGFGGGMMSSSSGTLTITGGYLLVQCDGDGIDVNGSAVMTDGTVIIYGPTRNGNGSLDYDGVFQVSGGTLLAVGSAGMAQAVTGTEKAALLAFTCSIPDNTLLHIEDSTGNAVITFCAPNQYSCVIFASERLCNGESYSVFAQGSHDGDETDGIYTNGYYSQGTLLGTLTI